MHQGFFYPFTGIFFNHVIDSIFLNSRCRRLNSRYISWKSLCLKFCLLSDSTDRLMFMTKCSCEAKSKVFVFLFFYPHFSLFVDL